MSTDPPAPATSRFRHCLTDIEVSPGNSDRNSKFSARIFVDEELICNLPWIDHTRPLRWSGLLLCNTSPLSKIALRLCKSTKDKPRYFNFPPVIVSEVDEVTGESTLELPEAIWVVTVKSFTSTMTEQLFPSELGKLDSIEGVYEDLDPDETIKYLFKSVLRFGSFAVEALRENTSRFSFLLFMKAWEALDQQTRIDDTVKDILRGLNSIGEILDSVGRASSLTLPTAVEQSKEPISDILTVLEDISIYILDRHAANDLVHIPRDEVELDNASKVEAYLARLEELHKAFYALWPATEASHINPAEDIDTESTTMLWQIVQTGTGESAETTDPYEILNLLRPMDPGNYDPEKACLDGTRETVLKKIITWTQNREHSERFMWVSGQPGMGKTAIATSLCQHLDKIQALAGSFFCRQGMPDVSDPLRLINNLVHTIALKLPPYAHEVSNAIRTDRSLCTSHFSLRYEGLVKRPFEKLKSLSPPKILVVVVDALDECGDNDSRQKIFEKLHELSRLVPWLKVIFTSRPERRLQEYFQKNCSHEPIVHLHSYDAFDDIRTYIHDQLQELSKLKSWPQGSLEQLCEMAEGVFLWAALAITYLQKSNFSTLSRLRKVLDNQPSPVTDHFDALYAKILLTTMEDNEDEIQDVYARSIAAILATSQQKPLAASSLQYLPLVIGQVDEPTFEHVVKDLCPLLTTTDGQYAKFYHSSFQDYISDRSRSGKFFIHLDRYGARHGDYCLQIMQQDLRFNICELESSHLSNKEVPDLRLRVHSRITPALKYACIYWIDHVLALPNQTLINAMKTFLEGPELMYWIEALSLLGRLDVAMDGLSKISLLELNEFDNWSVIVSWAKDIHRFLLTFSDAITMSTPHLYISALAFAPEVSTTAQRMRVHFPKTITVQGGDSLWHPCAKSVLHPHAVQSFSISPDGLTVIIGYPDGSLGLWDKQSSTRIQKTFTGHTDSVTCVVFSPNGNRAASSSRDTTIRVWEVTGLLKASSVLTGHSGPVHSVTFSPDATIIASGSSDKTIRLWDPNVMRPISEPYVGHSSDVTSVVFSPDGTKLVSGSRDKTIRVWSVDQRSPKLAGNPLLITAHSDSVTCLAFSPDGSKIASGSLDKTLRVWHTQTGLKIKAHTSPGQHSDRINTVAFSPNGKLIASGSSNGAIQLWDVTTLKAFSRPFGHSNAVNGVAYFPNGSRIISGSSDRTTRIWDIDACPKAGIATTPLAGPSSPILSITATKDGTRIVSVTNEQAVHMWDAQIGGLLCPPYVPGSETRIANLTCAAISLDGAQIVFSDSRNIKLWDIATRSFINTYQHGYDIQCLTFSHDGALIAFGSADAKVYLWEVAQWKICGNPLQGQGHSGCVTSVVFSPDGDCLASVDNYNRTLIMWDTKTRTRLSQGFSGASSCTSVAFSHCGTQIAYSSSNYVYVMDRKTRNSIISPCVSGYSFGPVAFSPDGAHIASGATNGAVWLWDAKTGQSIGSPFARHSAAVNFMTFLSDGKHLLSRSQHNSIRAWSIGASYPGVEKTGNSHNSYYGQRWPANPQGLTDHPHHPGWVTHDRRSLVFWLPAHYQHPNHFFGTSHQSASFDYSKFVHGTSWTSVASDSIKKSTS